MMNKLRMFVVSVLLVGSGAALGSNVEWNRLHSNYHCNEYGKQGTLLRGTPFITLLVISS